MPSDLPTYAEAKAAMESNTECRCGGTGKVSYDFQDRSPPVPIGDGLFVGPMGGCTTELCPCRSSLPRRHGDAFWWTTESVHQDRIEWHGMYGVSVEVSREVPVSRDNYPLHRTRDNSRFCVLADLTDVDATMLTSVQVRELAAWLNGIADRMDELDAPHPENPDA